MEDSPNKKTLNRRVLRLNSINETLSFAHTVGHSMNRDEIKEDNNDNFLTLDELDDLLKIVSGRKEHLWLPSFLRSNKNIDNSGSESFSPEAKK